MTAQQIREHLTLIEQMVISEIDMGRRGFFKGLAGAGISATTSKNILNQAAKLIVHSGSDAVLCLNEMLKLASYSDIFEILAHPLQAFGDIDVFLTNSQRHALENYAKKRGWNPNETDFVSWWLDFDDTNQYDSTSGENWQHFLRIAGDNSSFLPYEIHKIYKKYNEPFGSLWDETALHKLWHVWKYGRPLQGEISSKDADEFDSYETSRSYATSGKTSGAKAKDNTIKNIVSVANQILQSFPSGEQVNKQTVIQKLHDLQQQKSNPAALPAPSEQPLATDFSKVNDKEKLSVKK